MRKDRVLAGALAAVTALSMTACGGGQAGGTTQAAAAGTQAAVENTANPNAETTLSIGYTTFNDTATTEIYTLSLHDALPI